MPKREPGYCYHRPSGQAYVNLGGKVIYLGTYDSPESRERYARLKAEWLVNRSAEKFQRGKNILGPTMSDLCNHYLDEIEQHYGEKSAQAANWRITCRPVAQLYSTLPTKEFDSIAFMAVRDWWLKDPKRSRQYINKMMRQLRHMIKWGIERKYVPATVFAEVSCVQPLKIGRTTARESERVLPVDPKLVEGTIGKCTPILADMVKLQQLLGCRPGELVQIRPSMVDRSEQVWSITVDEHKNKHRGHARTIYAGPRAQAILAKYLLRDPDAPCFSPAESERQRQEAKRAARKTKVQPSQIDRSKPGATKLPRDAYDTNTYCRAIKYACLKAFPPPKEIKEDKQKLKEWKDSHTWHPNQLRHARATEVREQFGLEGASVVLGHADIETTKLYAERRESQAVEIARKIG